MKSYHFDLGNSTSGPVGYCARIMANSEEQAVQRLQQIIREQSAFDNEGEFEVWPGENGSRDEYLALYLNPDVITPADIDEVEDEED